MEVSMIKKRNFFLFTLIFGFSASIFTMNNNMNDNKKPKLHFDSPLGKQWAEYYRNQPVSAGKQQVYKLDPSYPKNGTLQAKKKWLQEKIEKSKKKADWSVLAPLASQAPIAVYARYGLAIAACGTVLFFPQQVAQFLLKDNIYYALYQGISNRTIGDFIGSMVNAPVVKNIVLSVAYPYLAYKGIKPIKDAVSTVKTKLSQATNWCASWFREPR